MKPMKAIRVERLRSLPLVLMVAAVSEGCIPASGGQRELMRADAEAFEIVVRSQFADTASAPAGFLSVDPRPGADEEILAGAREPARALDLTQSSDSLPASAIDGIT